MGCLDFQILSNISPATAIATSLVLFLGILYCALKDRGLPPGPRGLPYFGYWPFLKNTTAHLQLQDLVKKYGDVYSVTLMGQLYIHLASIKVIKEAHVTKSDCFANRYTGFGVLKLIFKEGIVALNGEPWKVQRKFFAQAFKELGMTSLKDYMTGPIYDCVLSTVENLKAEGGKPVNLISTLTLRCSAILRRTMFNDEGTTEEELESLLGPYKIVLGIFTNLKGLAVGEFARHVLFPLSSNYKPAMKNLNVMQDVLRTIIKRHEATFDKDNIRDIIDSYIKERNERRSKNDPTSKYFTENSLIDSLIEFVGDGIVFLAMFITYFIDALVDHPEEQEKVFKELEEVIGPDRQPTLEDKSKLPYTNAFIQEVLRMTDSFPLFPSLMCTKETTLNGYKIPKGAMTLMNIWASQRNPNSFEDPDVFKPSRYVIEPGKRKAEQPIIFGIGKRSCIGESFAMMQVFLFVAAIVKNFHLKRPEGFNRKSALDVNVQVCAHPRK